MSTSTPSPAILAGRILSRSSRRGHSHRSAQVQRSRCAAPAIVGKGKTRFSCASAWQGSLVCFAGRSFSARRSDAARRSRMNRSIAILAVMMLISPFSSPVGAGVLQGFYVVDENNLRQIAITDYDTTNNLKQIGVDD